MKKSIRYKTKLKYVEYVEICVLSSQQTSLKYFVSFQVYFPKVSKPIFFSDFNGNDETNKIAPCVENIHWDFLKNSFYYFFLGEGEGEGGGGSVAFREETKRVARGTRVNVIKRIFHN